jgi:hypothetical protein
MTFADMEEVKEARNAACVAVPGGQLLSERQVERALAGNRPPRTWSELGDVVSLLNPPGGLRLTDQAAKAISVALQIPSRDVRVAFDVFMWGVEPPERPIPVFKRSIHHA